MRQKTALLLLSLALTTIFILQPEAATSGEIGREPLTKEEIVELLVDDFIPLPETLFDEDPVVTAPYAPGKLTEAAQLAAVARLNAIHTIAGLPTVSYWPSFGNQAQYGAVLLCASNYAHYPVRPSDMDSDFYATASKATASSNLYAKKNLITAVDGFMDDSDSYNLPVLGHRRWQLSPYLGKVGFGYAEKADGVGYVVEQIWDMTGERINYNFISWPASGNFPQEFMENKYIAWSVMLNTKTYKVPTVEDLTVTMTRQEDGKVWTLHGEYDVTSKAYLRISSESGLPGPCIIFRPDGIDSYTGSYTVQITGLYTKDGEPTSITYDVDFFALSDYEENPVSDVSRTNWAYEAIRSLYKAGVAQVISQPSETGKFAYRPSQGLSWGDFAVMLAKSFYGEEITASTTDDLPGLAYTLLTEKGFSLEDNEAIVSRYDLAHALFHVMTETLGWETEDYDLSEELSDEHVEAVSMCYQYGLTAGKGSAGFCGDNDLSRAEAAVVFDRLLRRVHDAPIAE